MEQYGQILETINLTNLYLKNIYGMISFICIQKHAKLNKTFKNRNTCSKTVESLENDKHKF